MDDLHMLLFLNVIKFAPGDVHSDEGIKLCTFSGLKTILMSLLTSQSNASPLVKVLSLGL